MSDSLFIYKYKYKYRYIRAFICLYSRIPQLAKMEGQTITTVHAACHCGKNSFTLHYPSASLPVSSGICHCDSTRHATGMLFGTFVPIPDGTSLIADVNSPPPSVREYRSSTIGSRYFCATCGAKLAFYHRGFDKWLIAIGLLERVDGIVKIERHQWVGDTGDGSILQVMKDDLPRYSQGPDSGMFVTRRSLHLPIRRSRRRASVRNATAVASKRTSSALPQHKSKTKRPGLNASPALETVGERAIVSTKLAAPLLVFPSRPGAGSQNRTWK
jgi:hypothetical protein